MIVLAAATRIWRASDPRCLSTRARRAMRSAKLPGAFHPDRADRIIVATALENAVPTITPDERIHAYPSLAVRVVGAKLVRARVPELYA